MMSTERKSKFKQNTIRIFFCWEMRFKTKSTSEKPAKPHIMRPFVNLNQESITCKELSHLSSVRLKVHTMNKESELNKHTEQKLANATKLSRKSQEITMNSLRDMNMKLKIWENCLLLKDKLKKLYKTSWIKKWMNGKTFKEDLIKHLMLLNLKENKEALNSKKNSKKKNNLWNWNLTIMKTDSRPVTEKEVLNSWNTKKKRRDSANFMSIKLNKLKIWRIRLLNWKKTNQDWINKTKDSRLRREQQRQLPTSDSTMVCKKERAQSQFATIRNLKRKKSPQNTSNKKRTINKTWSVNKCC